MTCPDCGEKMKLKGSTYQCPCGVSRKKPSRDVTTRRRGVSDPLGGGDLTQIFR
ncbi:MAG: hypothetical protein Q7T51_04135 [Candidatus Moranbacteria bacterium]|nr:hypothetical protein [Candidatus Moranbacteria bacterium]